MSKKANPTVIGGFVVGAIALAIAGIAMFGSGKFFARKEYYVMYFQGSTLKGLNIGSPVTFRGIRVGLVTDIQVFSDPEALAFHIPVFIDIDPERFKEVSGEGKYADKESKELVDRLIKAGLRAQLQLQSLVTGLLVVDLDMHADTPVKLHGTKHLDISEKYVEIPTIPSTAEQLAKMLENLNLKELVEDVKETLDGVKRLATSPELAASIQELKDTLTAGRTLVQHVDQKVEPLTASVIGTMDAFRGTANDASKLATNIDGQVVTLISDFKQRGKEVSAALRQAEKTLATLEDVAAEAPRLRYELTKVLSELTAAARSVRILADFLERHPDALLRGKTETGGN